MLCVFIRCQFEDRFKREKEKKSRIKSGQDRECFGRSDAKISMNEGDAVMDFFIYCS